MFKKHVVIFDIDGTISDPGNRLHYIAKEKDSGHRDWKAFFESSIDDPVQYHVAILARVLYLSGFHVVFATARPEEYRHITEEWFTKHGIYYDHLLMRPTEDRRIDTIVKREMVLTFLAEANISKDSVLGIFEDRLPVCEIWVEEGFPVFVCGTDWIKGDWSK